MFTALLAVVTAPVIALAFIVGACGELGSKAADSVMNEIHHLKDEAAKKKANKNKTSELPPQKLIRQGE